MSWHPMPAHVYQTLLSRQQSLTEIQLNYTEGSIDSMVGYGSRSLLDNFKEVNRLDIMPGPAEPLSQAARKFLQDHQEIRALGLEFSHMEQSLEVGEVDNLYTSGGAVQALFTGLKPSAVCLRQLELTGVNLRGSHRDWFSTLNLQALEELSVVHCRNAEDFLAALNKSVDRPSTQLQEFTFYHSQQWNPPNPGTAAGSITKSVRVLEELDDLVGSTSNTLVWVWICLRGFDKLPNATKIAQHGKSLKRLFVDVRTQKGPWAVNYPLEEWRQLCSSLENIRQLDATYPPVVADCNIDIYSDFSDQVVSDTVLYKLSWQHPPYLVVQNNH